MSHISLASFPVPKLTIISLTSTYIPIIPFQDKMRHGGWRGWSLSVCLLKRWIFYRYSLLWCFSNYVLLVALNIWSDNKTEEHWPTHSLSAKHLRLQFLLQCSIPALMENLTSGTKSSWEVLLSQLSPLLFIYRWIIIFFN